MENIKVWAASLCVFCVVLLFYKMLFPSGNLRKTGETVIALLLLFLMLRPFKAIEANAVASSWEREWEAVYDGQEANYHTAGLEAAIADALEGIEVYPSDIQVQADMDAQQYLVLSGVQLTVSTEKTDGEIKDCLLKALEIPETLITIVR